MLLSPMDAGLEIGRQFVVGPGADALLAIGGDVRRVPIVDRPAGEGALEVRLHREPLGRMAIAAMAEAVDEIGAAVHLGRTSTGRGGIRLRRKKSAFQPTSGADVEWEGQAGLLRGLVRRGNRSKVRADGERVVTRHAGEPLIGERGVEVLPVAADALMHRAIELVVRPGADSLFASGVMFGA